ncbi:hypothetical protein [Streptacidiphilus anmyonensis]|uniref:hypothetical protein n=1 Tax=Streptacidiphilus anmyonensis TaxID=405782 RepID=UPI000694A4AE|nr:hypothetical protein [Streptacidiphilus anmyonensis]
MSLPISRRIVQAALVVAAGAVPAVAAGTAQAAPALPTVPDLGGLSQLNSAPDLGGSLESTAHQTGELAGSGVGQAASNGVPVVADAAGHEVGQAVPGGNRSMGSSVTGLLGTASQVVGAAHDAGVARSMPATANASGTMAGDTPAVAPAAQAPASSSNPLSSLPLASSLPVNSLPLSAAGGALGGGATRSGAPMERLGGLPDLASSATPQALSSATGALPGLSGLPLGGLPINGLPL